MMTLGTMTKATVTATNDAGAASVVLVWSAAIIAMIGLGATLLGTLAYSQTRVSQAADLAALAGAQQVWSGATSACAAAAGIASAHGARMTSCTSVGLDLQVSVEAPLVGQLASLGSVRATARAGPPE